MVLTEKMKAALAAAQGEVDKAGEAAGDTGGVWGAVAHVLVAGAHLVLGLVEDEYEPPESA